LTATSRTEKAENVKTEHVKIKATGPEGSGKTIVIRVLQKALHRAGVTTSVENVFHTLEFPPLTEKQIQKLLK
jgi:adenylylsulfate kinase-like enzyme